MDDIQKELAFDAWLMLASKSQARHTAKRDGEPTKDPREDAPYPWCHGNPTVHDCIQRGYCGRDPNCGE